MTTDYPLPKFHFLVDWGEAKAGFTEVTGLNVDVESIEYRGGGTISYNKLKMPGLRKYSNITLKRGVVQLDSPFYSWLTARLSNELIRHDILISLLNENHEPLFTWKVKNAFPVKIQTADLKADTNEVAIETLEIAHEGIAFKTS